MIKIEVDNTNGPPSLNLQASRIATSSHPPKTRKEIYFVKPSFDKNNKFEEKPVLIKDFSESSQGKPLSPNP